MGTLRELTVQPATRQRYDRATQQFLRFLKDEGQVLPRDKSKLDPLVCDYVEHLWASGAGRGLACDTLAGLQDHQPNLKNCLPGAWRLLETWHVNEIPNRAPPLPASVVHSMAGWAFFHNHVTFGVSLLVGFYTMLRTGELLGLRSSHLMCQPTSNQVLISLGFTKGGKRTGAAESVILGFEPAVKLVKRWKTLATSSTPLAHSPAHWRGLFNESLSALKLDTFGFRPYSLRRGGEVKYTKSCKKPIKDTSDMLCSCRRKPRVDDPHCDWPGPPKPEKRCCKNMKQWPDVDNGVTCGDCMALILADKYGGRCDRYCESFGQVCIMAAEEQEENCEVKYEVPCDQAITGTSDILCKCGKRNAPPQCPVPPATTQTTTPTPSPNKRIQVVGKQILVDGTPLHLKGVAWNPVPKGGAHPADLDFSSAVEEDAKLMKTMGINAVRTYEPITEKWVLDTLWSQGIWVVNSVYNWGGADADSAAAPVKATKDHPAILMWTIGNEWNYNGLYVGSSFFDCVGRIRDVANVILEHDTSHPIASIFGDVGKLDEAVDSLPEIEIWGINAYRGISFGNLFQQYEGATSKPMFFGEYGADAFNAKISGEDQDAQAKATKELTEALVDLGAEEILRQSSVLGRGSCVGGFIFEFNDEWHKDNDGSKNRHDTGGTAPGGGPYPDMTFNEEWWGLVNIDRETRKAFDAYKDTDLPTAAQKITA
eukprot:s423_g23.t1